MTFTTPYERYAEIILLLVLGVIIVVALLWIGSLPGSRSHRRGHPRAMMIRKLGWFGLLCPPIWFVAMWWASRAFILRPRATLHVRVRPRDHGLRHAHLAEDLDDRRADADEFIGHAR